MITPELRKKIENCHSLPSPPGVATKIIELANDPEVDIARIADVLALDPAITAKILRIANSPMYARQRKTENLKQALMVIGLNATISLALSFSLLKSWQASDQAGGLDYPLYWRRALLGATASHVLARVIGIKDGEELFLACLIQDIGVMALDRVVPDLYAGLGPEQGRQAALIKREQERIGVDHAAVSGWLLDKWQFPERTQQVVAASHDPDRLDKQSAECRIRALRQPLQHDRGAVPRHERCAGVRRARPARASVLRDRQGRSRRAPSRDRPDDSGRRERLRDGDPVGGALGDDSLRGARGFDAAQSASAA